MKKGWVLMAVLSLFVVGCLTVPAFAAGKGISKADKAFIKDAASGGMMEVQLGKEAQDKGTMPEVKAFGQRMVIDHGKANDELKELAQKKGVKSPAKIKVKHKRTVDMLSGLSKEKFDRKYMEEMVKDHKNDVAKFKKAADKVKDRELKAWVDKTLPVLEQHLQQAKELAQKMGVTVK